MSVTTRLRSETSQHVALKRDLEDLLGEDVDVVTENTLHWYIRDRILEETPPI